MNFNGIRYSVPWQCSGKNVQICTNAEQYEIYYGEILLTKHPVQSHRGNVVWPPDQYQGLAERKGIAAPYPVAKQRDVQVKIRSLSFYDRTTTCWEVISWLSWNTPVLCWSIWACRQTVAQLLDAQLECSLQDQQIYVYLLKALISCEQQERER